MVPSLAKARWISDAVHVHSIRTYALALLVAAGGMGCEAASDNERVCLIWGLGLNIPPPIFTDEVDLLFVIDNSQSMAEEQRSLAAELPRLLDFLGAGVGPDGSTFLPLNDVRVGVVTTDMGSGGFAVPTCQRGRGGDGRLRRRTERALVLPDGSPPFLTLHRDTDNTHEEAAQLVEIGTGGCSIRQPLEATLQALSPDGHGRWDSPNEGFLRPVSFLALVVLSNSDDCSAADPELFNQDSDIYTEPNLNLRCWRDGDVALHPVERYVDGLLSLRDSDRLFFALLAGVPEDLAQAPGESPDFASLTGAHADARLRNVPDPTMPTVLTPSCETASQGSAVPPSRLIHLAEGLAEEGAEVVVQSVCQDSYAPAIDAIIAGLRNQRRSSCFTGPLPRDAEGRRRCSVREWLPLEGGSCGDLDGRVFDEVDAETGQQVCRVCQLNPDGSAMDDDAECQHGEGWFYEAEPEWCPEHRSQGFSFTEGAVPAAGSVVRSGCGNRLRVHVGASCAGDPRVCEDGIVGGVALICDPLFDRCVMPCSNDDDCDDSVETCHDPDNDGRGSCLLTSCPG